jgi:hypothetical protein
MVSKNSLLALFIVICSTLQYIIPLKNSIHYLKKTHEQEDLVKTIIEFTIHRILLWRSKTIGEAENTYKI